MLAHCFLYKDKSVHLALSQGFSAATLCWLFRVTAIELRKGWTTASKKLSAGGISEVRKPNLQPLATRSSVSYFTIITDHSVTTHPPLSGDTAIIEFISNVI